jgi:uncharacterized protein YmfQ (DUF2313 family)
MAIDFTGSVQLYSTAGSPVTAAPLTMAAWIKLTDYGAVGNLSDICYVQNSTGQENFRLALTSGHPWIRASSGGTFGQAYNGSVTATLNAWQHICGVCNSTTLRAIFLNGGSKLTDTTYMEPGGVSQVFVNAGGSGPNTHGQIADVAVWNAALTDAEVLALAKGICPAFIRPSKLQLYLPLQSISGYPNFSNNLARGQPKSFTIGGSFADAATQPPIGTRYYYSSRAPTPPTPFQGTTWLTTARLPGASTLDAQAGQKIAWQVTAQLLGASDLYATGDATRKVFAEALVTGQFDLQAAPEKYQTVTVTAGMVGDSSLGAYAGTDKVVSATFAGTSTLATTKSLIFATAGFSGASTFQIAAGTLSLFSAFATLPGASAFRADADQRHRVLVGGVKLPAASTLYAKIEKAGEQEITAGFPGTSDLSALARQNLKVQTSKFEGSSGLTAAAIQTGKQLVTANLAVTSTLTARVRSKSAIYTKIAATSFLRAAAEGGTGEIIVPPGEVPLVPTMASIVHTGDRFMRRDGTHYASALADLLPQGLAWPRDIGSVLMQTVRGLAGIWGYVDSRASHLLTRESDPRRTIDLLIDWERAYGLPDPCLEEPLTIADRQRILVKRITYLGAQSRAFFIGVAKDLGYEVQIREYAPFMTGISRCGITLDDQGYLRWQVGPPELRFFWTVRVDVVTLRWFRCSSGICGIDPLLRIGLATDLECIIRRWKPAHTYVIFNYWGSEADAVGQATVAGVGQ